MRSLCPVPRRTAGEDIAMHLTTNALVLREVNYKESDKILTVLTDQEGKLTVSARGCRKKGSAIAAPCQLLVYSEMTLYEYQGRWAVKEAATQRRFDGVRSDLDKLALASYFAELAEAVTYEALPAPEILALALNALYALGELGKDPQLVKAAFEFRLMALAGFEPLTDGCARCGAVLPERPVLDVVHGEVLCASCYGGGGISMPLEESGLAALRHVLGCPPKRLYAFSLDEQSLQRLGHAAEAYAAAQLERGFRTLDFYKSLRHT